MVIRGRERGEAGPGALQAGFHLGPGPGELRGHPALDRLGNGEPQHVDYRILLPDEARELASRLALDPVRALASVHASGLVCWAPAASAALGRLLAAYIQLAA